MEIDTSTVITTILTAGVSIMSYFTKGWFNSVNDRLDQQDEQLIKVRLEYVKKEELREMEQRIVGAFNKLDNKIDTFLLNK